jgi:rhodanese-related sulfurtransferase
MSRDKGTLVLILIVALLAFIGYLVYYANSSPLLISAEEAKAKINQGEFDVIVDVRTQFEYDLGHYPHSVHIPVNEIKKNARKEIKNPDARILVYCNTGQRSRLAAEILMSLGYKNVRYISGTFKGLL